ncbi:putative serine/arginine repetitive matrix protein 2-like 6, partial [Homarus americanus]
GTPSDPPSLGPSAPPSMTSSFVSEDTPATTPATPAADGDTFSQKQLSANNSSEDHLTVLEGSQFSGVVTRPPGDRWQPQSQPSSSSSAPPKQTPMCEEAVVSPIAHPYPHNSNTVPDKGSLALGYQATSTNKSSATNQQAKINAFKNSKSPNLSVPVISPVHGTQTLPQIVEKPLQPLYSNNPPPSTPPPTLKLPSNLPDTIKKRSYTIGGGAIPKVSDTHRTASSKFLFTRNVSSYDGDTEEACESLLTSDSDERAHTLCCSRSVEVQTEACKGQECDRPPRSPSLSVTSSPTHRTKPKTTRSLNSPIPPPIPPRNKPLKSPIKKSGSVNWLDRSSSIVDLGNLFEEVKQSREILHKSRDSLYRSSEKSTLSVSGPLSRTKSVNNIQHLGLARTRDSGLSQSSWELGDADTSSHFRSQKLGSSFNEDQRPNMLSVSSNIKRSPALRRLTGREKLGINVEDSVYHTVHTPSHASVNPRTKSRGRPGTPNTPAFQEDVYYTIQGGAGVTQHYQTEESRAWQPSGSMPMHHPKTYYNSSSSSSEEGFEEDDPLYEPLHESPTNVSPTEAYIPHYPLETPYLSPRSPKYYFHHHSPPHTMYYPPLSPKSPKHHLYSPKSSHQYSHSPHQMYPNPQCSPQSSHCPQSYHYPCTCMHQSYPNPLCSRPWPSPTAQLETGRSCSWTEDEELETVRHELEDLSEDDDSFQQLLSKQEHEEVELRRRHQQEREAFKVLRLQRCHQNRRPKSLRLASSPGPPPSGTTPTSPLCQTDDTHSEGCKELAGISDSVIMSDHSGETSTSAVSSGTKKGRTISEDMLELVQNLGPTRPQPRPPPGKMTLNQMMAQQKTSTLVPPIGQRPFYSSVGIAAGPYPGQYFSAYQTFPIPYQRLSDGSYVAVSKVDDGSAAPSSTSSSSSNIQQQQPPATSASWVHWQQQ